MKKSVLKKPSDIKDVFGAFLLEGARYAGKYDMPVVKSNVDKIPEHLESYQIAGRKEKKILSGTALHFYIYDYIFDGEQGVWNSLVRGVEFKRGFNLKKLEGNDYIIVPDLSLYGDMPLVVMQMWIVYRARAIAYALQQLGFKVIINVRWTDESSYEFCFDGIEHGSVVAVGSYGCSKASVDRYLFDKGLEELIKRVQPECIFFYGTVTDSMKVILDKYNQNYVAFVPDSTSALEEYKHGNESE